MDCPFCDYAGPSEVLYRGRHTFIIEPLNPVAEGHLLVIPHDHVEDFAENSTITGWTVTTAAWWIHTQDHHERDWNLIASKGKAATQTVSHLHFHLVPRQQGDGLALPWNAPTDPENI